MAPQRKPFEAFLLKGCNEDVSCYRILFDPCIWYFRYQTWKKIQITNKINESKELRIWSLRISGVQRIPARNCVLAFLKHDQSTQYG
jgi:hypothetical protein